MTLTHPRLEELQDYLEGRLHTDHDPAVESHLGECPECQEVLRVSPKATDAFGRLLAAALARHDQREETLAAQRTLPHAGKPEAPAPPNELLHHPRYRLTRFLGNGGMGTVWLAEHTVMGRPVALKMIRPDILAHDGMVERFRREVRAAARLHHPNLAIAYDAEQAGRLHFLVMEYLPGETLAHAVKAGPLPVAEACRAVRDAALGLAHAHAQGLIHRDLKPGNLMRGPDGTVKVLDFGLVACGLAPALTCAGLILGTADYIAPEQAEDGSRADARSDIYSLGCTLYHLLSGCVPYPVESTLGKLDAHRAKTNPVPIAGIDGPLAAIVARMMATDPTKRYTDASEVAAALEPHCRGVTIEKPPRRRWAVAAAILGSIILVAAAGVTRIQSDTGTLVIETTDNDVEVSVKQNGKLVTVIDPKTKSRITLNSGVYTFEVNGAATDLKLDIESATLKRGDTVIGKITRSAAAANAPLRADEHVQLPGITETVYAVAFSADGRRAAVGGGNEWDRHFTKPRTGRDYSVRIYELPGGKLLHRCTGHFDLIHSLAFSPDGRWLASASNDCTVRIWDPATGQLVKSLPHERRVLSVAFSPDSSELLTGRDDQDALTFWSTVTWEPNPRGPEWRLKNPFHQALFSPDGRTVAICGWATLTLQDRATGQYKKPMELRETLRIGMVEFSRDGRRILTRETVDVQPQQARLRVRSVETGELLWQGPGTAGAFQTADGSRVLVAGINDDVLSLWDVAASRELRRFVGHRSTVATICVSPDGRHALSGGIDNSARLWSIAERR